MGYRLSLVPITQYSVPPFHSLFMFSCLLCFSSKGFDAGHHAGCMDDMCTGNNRFYGNLMKMKAFIVEWSGGGSAACAARGALPLRPLGMYTSYGIDQN